MRVVFLHKENLNNDFIQQFLLINEYMSKTGTEDKKLLNKVIILWAQKTFL